MRKIILSTLIIFLCLTPTLKAEEPLLGEWKLVSYNNQKYDSIIADDDKFFGLPSAKSFISFENDGRFFADLGCNKLSGSLVVKKKGDKQYIEFKDGISTLMACPEIHNMLINDLFFSNSKFTIEGNILTFISSSKTSIVFKK